MKPSASGFAAKKTLAFLALGFAGLASGLVRSQAPGPEIPKGSNVILGRVLESEKDAPIAGAVVTLTGYFDPSGRPGNPPALGIATNASAPKSVITTTEGNFLFRDLPAGKYSVVANSFGYVSSSWPLKIIELNDHDQIPRIQLHLSRFAVISGTVIDERGDPMPGVPVVALKRVMSGGSIVLRSTSARAETDDRGMYRMAQLAPGNYVVGVVSATTSLPIAVAAAVEPSARYPGEPLLGLLPSGVFMTTGEGVRVTDSVIQWSGPAPPPPSPDGRMLAYPTTFAPAAMLPSEATSIALGSGEQRTGVDVTLRLSPAVRVSGIARGPDGPMKNLAVRLLPPGAVDSADMDPAGSATAVTDASGAFVFPSVTPGSYTLRSAFVDQGRPDLGTADVSLWAMQPLTVGDTDATGLTVSLKTGVRISGRIEFKGSEPPTRDGLGMVVLLRPVGAQAWRTLRGIVAADGSFTTPGDPPGRYTVDTNAPPGWFRQTLTRSGKVVLDDVIELDNDDLSGFVFTLSKQTTGLSGSITNAGGASDGEADVFVFPADSTYWRQGIMNNRRVSFRHATSSGAFEFSALAPGEYYVAAVGSQFTTDWDDPLALERLIPGASRVTVVEGETKTVQLRTFIPKAK